MSPRQLRAFVAIAQTLSFARASEQLHLSQPALSLTIRDLESDLGGRLLERSTRQVRLTPEGQTLLPLAINLLEDWDRTRETLLQRFSLREGTVTMAAMPSFAVNVLPAILQAYRVRHPGVRVTVHDIVHEQVLDEVERGRIELGVGFEPESDRALVFTPLFDDRFIAILPPTMHTPEGDQLSWPELLRSDFITLQQPSVVRRLMAQRLGEQGITLRVALECHQLATVGQMVAAGLGVSAVPQLCRPQMTAIGCRCVTLTQPVVGRAVGLLSRRGAALSSAARALHDCAREVAGSADRKT